MMTMMILLEAACNQDGEIIKIDSSNDSIITLFMALFHVKSYVPKADRALYLSRQARIKSFSLNRHISWLVDRVKHLVRVISIGDR